MKNISAVVIFSYMTPDALVDYMQNLPGDDKVANELYEMAYNALVANVGKEEADDMLEPA